MSESREELRSMILANQLRKANDDSERLRAIVESFIRRIHCDGDSTLVWDDVPALLDAIADEFERARDENAKLTKDSENLAVMVRRLARFVPALQVTADDLLRRMGLQGSVLREAGHSAVTSLPATVHERRCHDCGHVGLHADNITPYVLCPKCGSQDTRRTKKVLQ